MKGVAHYDGLVLYANHVDITPAQEQAFVDFVEGGKAIIAIHCASFMFTKAPRYIPIIGGQFLRHGHRIVPVEQQDRVIVLHLPTTGARGPISVTRVTIER